MVVEDLISTGGSSIAAAKDLETFGVEILGIVAIFDYELDKAKRNFEASGYHYKTLSNYSILLEEAWLNSYITKEEAQILKSWNRDPQAWSDKHGQ